MTTIPLSRITIKSLKMLLVAVLIAILNFKIVASVKLKNKKDKDTFYMLKSAGIINIMQEARDHQHMSICLA